MKHYFWYVLLLSGILSSCQKSDNKSNQPLFTGKQLEGRWYWVRSIVTLKFDDGTTQHVDINGERSEWIEFERGDKTKERESGIINKGGATGDATGAWSLVFKDYSLTIQYILPDQFGYLYRTIDDLNDTQLILTANDDQVLWEYQDNGLSEVGGKKLIGGSVFEQYER